MAMGLTDSQNLTDIADAIRAQNGSDDEYTPSEMASAIRGISSGSSIEAATETPLANGTASVGVSERYAREDHVHPEQTDVTGNAGTATKLATARAIDGVAFDGSKAVTHYGTCSTSSTISAKVATLSDTQTFSLVTGATVTIRFTYANAYANPTLNVNDTGAKNIRYRNANLQAGKIVANSTHTFVYDGTYWQLIGDLDTNITYNTVFPVYNGYSTGTVLQSTLYLLVGLPEAQPADQYYSGYDSVSPTSTAWAATVAGVFESMVYGQTSYDDTTGFNLYMPQSNATIALRVEGALLGSGSSPVTLVLNTYNRTERVKAFPVVYADGTPVTQVAERTILVMTFDLIENYNDSTGVLTYDGRWIVHSGGAGGSSGDASWQWVTQGSNQYLALVTED